MMFVRPRTEWHSCDLIESADAHVARELYVGSVQTEHTAQLSEKSPWPCRLVFRLHKLHANSLINKHYRIIDVMTTVNNTLNKFPSMETALLQPS